MSEHTFDVTTFGETMALITAPQIQPLRHATSLGLSTGGAESNTVIGLRRLGHQASWMGRVGDDEFGLRVLSDVRGEGVDTSHATVDPTAPTGLMVRSQRTASMTGVTYYRAQSAGSMVSPDVINLDTIAQSRVLYLTGITPALSPSAREACFVAVEHARSSETVVCFDPNYRSRLWSTDEAVRCFNDLAALSDVVLVGGDEAKMMCSSTDPSVLKAALVLQATDIVVRQGAGKVSAVIEDESYARTSETVDVVDLVGAGDAFAAGYISGLLDGQSPEERLDLASRVAAIAVSTNGDWEGLPSRSELDSLSESDSRVVR